MEAVLAGPAREAVSALVVVLVEAVLAGLVAVALVVDLDLVALAGSRASG